MDRRRFTPSAEGLEGRALLSGLFGGSTLRSASANATLSARELPETYQQRLNRIDHLPYYLRQSEPSRSLPPDTILQLQTDLRTVVAQLHGPTAPVVDTFNSGLRQLLPDKTLSPANAVRVNHSFGAVLEHAGASIGAVAGLQADMNALAKVDVQSNEPSLLARQDYALVLQTALNVGRPIQTPTPAILKTGDGLRAKDNKSGTTHDHNPTMVGTYQAGATKVGYLRIQIIDAHETVLGSGVVDPTGNYSVKLQYLPDGVYQLRSRGEDEVGHVSAPSPHAFILTVKDRRGTHVTTASVAPLAAVTRTTTITSATQYLQSVLPPTGQG